MPVRLTPRPARLAITTMRPLPFFFMPGVTARLAKNAPSTLTAWIARQSSSLTSSTGRLALAAHAARDMHQHIDATAGLFDFAHEGVNLPRLRQVDRARLQGAAALRLGPRLQSRKLVFQHIAGPHPGAAFDEAIDDPAADAARGAGDDDGLVVEMDVHQPLTPPPAPAEAGGTRPSPARRRVAPRCRRRDADAPAALPSRRRCASSCSGAS